MPQIVANQGSLSGSGLAQGKQIKSLAGETGAELQSRHGARLAEHLAQNREVFRGLEAERHGIANTPQICHGDFSDMAHQLESSAMHGSRPGPGAGGAPGAGSADLIKGARWFNGRRSPFRFP